MDWLQKNASEFKPTKTLVLDEIKRRSVIAFEKKDKTLLPTVQEMSEVIAASPRTISGMTLELLRDDLIVRVQDGKLKRYAVNYDVV